MANQEHGPTSSDISRTFEEVMGDAVVPTDGLDGLYAPGGGPGELVDGPEGAHESFEYEPPSPEEVERVWRRVWLPAISEVVEDGDGTRRRRFNLHALKAELFDYNFLIDNARRVYRHITGGLCEDLTASAAGINAMADRKRGELLEDVQRLLEREQDRRVEAEARVRQLEGELERLRAREEGEDGEESGAGPSERREGVRARAARGE